MERSADQADGGHTDIDGYTDIERNAIMIGSTYPLLDIFWTMLEIFIFILWIWLLIAIFSDIFRSHDMSGWAKALWVIFLVVFPLLGILVYLIVRGGTMHERAAAQAQREQRAFDDYVRQTAGAGSSNVDQLAKLADLKSQGVISDEEFATEKAKLLG